MSGQVHLLLEPQPQPSETQAEEAPEEWLCSQSLCPILLLHWVLRAHHDDNPPQETWVHPGDSLQSPPFYPSYCLHKQARNGRKHSGQVLGVHPGWPAFDLPVLGLPSLQAERDRQKAAGQVGQEPTVGQRFPDPVPGKAEDLLSSSTSKPKAKKQSSEQEGAFS